VYSLRDTEMCFVFDILKNEVECEEDTVKNKITAERCEVNEVNDVSVIL